MTSKHLQSLKQHIARQGEKASRWFEPLTLSSRDFSVLFIKKLKVIFHKTYHESDFVKQSANRKCKSFEEDYLSAYFDCEKYWKMLVGIEKTVKHTFEWS